VPTVDEQLTVCLDTKYSCWDQVAAYSSTPMWVCPGLDESAMVALSCSLSAVPEPTLWLMIPIGALVVAWLWMLRES